jgi:uncharacterized SAM-binding protein YcdF (DUF218 family)
LIGVFAAALLFGIGLLKFAADLPAPGSGAPAAADGVVVYTGVGGQRIAAGMSLLQQGAGQRLLISGVNPGTSRESLAAMWTGDPEAFDCCVDLGLEARTTVGNAREVGRWAKEHGFSHLILVTSDYHMPRALLETRAQMPDLEIAPYPVQSGYIGASGRPSSAEAWRRLAVEFSKYLAVRVRTLRNSV